MELIFLIFVLGFKKEEVKLNIDGLGNITATGQRQVNEDKMVYFDQSFKLPENSDDDKISGRFEGEILYVTVPKQAVKENVSDWAKQIEHERKGKKMVTLQVAISCTCLKLRL